MTDIGTFTTTKDINTDLVWDDETNEYVPASIPSGNLIVNELEANDTIYDIVPKAVLDNNTDYRLKVWTGTKAQYDAITTKDPYTLYNITDDAATISLLEMIYPVGSIYIGTMSTCPLAALFGTWTKVSSGQVLQGSDANHAAGTTIEAGLPNITGSFVSAGSDASGCVSNGERTGGWAGGNYDFNTKTIDASRSSSIYGNSDTVQPPAFIVNIWKRTA